MGRDEVDHPLDAQGQLAVRRRRAKRERLVEAAR
jgi:hypothetical protein